LIAVHNDLKNEFKCFLTIMKYCGILRFVYCYFGRSDKKVCVERIKEELLNDFWKKFRLTYFFDEECWNAFTEEKLAEKLL